MTQNIQQQLQKVSLFSDLSEEMLASIASQVKEHNLSANDILFHEGEEGNTLYIIQAGEIEIYDEDAGKKVTTLATLKAGEYFGEMALIEEKPRSASARAITDVSLLTLDRQTFVTLLENNGKLSLKMTSVIAGRLRSSQPVEQAQTEKKNANLKSSTTKVFISYSRKDKVFVQQLHEAISEKGIDTWVDWENIPLTADWWNEIQTGIENADAFAFVISPDSLNSEVCGREIQTAVDNNKRLIPILHREPQPGNPMHEKISSHNWVYMRSDDELKNNLPQMLEIVNTDLGWVRQHTRLRERALEWERANKNTSFMLQGTDLQNAEKWLEEAGNKEPQPTSLHIEYIQASRRVSTVKQRSLMIYTLIGLVVTVVLAIISFISFLSARSAEQEARTNEALAQTAQALAQGSAATAEAEKVIALTAQSDAEYAQATAEADRNLAATAQADAEAQEFIARTARLETLPLTMLDSQLDLGLLMSIEAYRFNPSLSSEGTLFTAWSHNPELIRYLQGHEHGVDAAAWSPENHLATSGEDGIIILWDNFTGQPAAIFEPIDGEILALAWSSDGQLASGDSNGNVIIWDVANGVPASILTGHQGEVNSVAWTLKNDITSGGEDGKIIVWNIPRAQPRYTLTKDNAAILDLDWSPIGLLASANSDSTVTVWGQNEVEETIFESDTFTGTTSIPRTSLTLIHPDVHTIAWSPENPNQLASGGFQDIQIWDLLEFSRVSEPIKTLTGHSLFVNSLSWSDRGELASGSSDNTVIIWDLGNGRPRKTYRGHNDWVISVDWSREGILASASLDKKVILWHPEARAGNTMRGHEGWVYTTGYAPDGTLASGGEGDDIILWDLERGQPETTLSGHSDTVLTLDWSSEGQLASGGLDRDVILWNLETRRPAQTLSRHSGAVDTVLWSSDGQLASSDEGGTVIVWDLESGQPRWMQEGNGLQVVIAWSPNNELTIASDEGPITILDATTFDPIQTLTGEEHIRVMAWSPDGRLVTDGRDYQLVIWNRETGQPETRLRGHSNSVTSLAWSADGKLASSAEDSSIILWDLDGGEPAFIFRGHSSLVQDISWAPGDAQFASASLDSTVMVWDVTPEEWIKKNCSRAGRNFRQDEWASFFPDEEYRVTCDNQPVPGETP